MIENRKKIIYVYPDHFEKRDYDRFGVDIVKEQYEVEIWSLVDCIYNHKISVPTSLYTGCEVIYFQNWNEYKKAVCRNRNSIFWDFSHMALHEFGIKKMLIRYRCIYLNFYFAPVIPEIQTEQDVITNNYGVKQKIRSYLDLLIQFKFGEIMYRIRTLIYAWTVQKVRIHHYTKEVEKNPPEIYFIATDYCRNLTDIYAKRIVRIHTLDYDKYLDDISNAKRIIEERYIVFVDQYLAEHADYEKEDLNKFSHEERENYYNQLKKIFTKLEKQYKCEVVIAVHPRADYSEDVFGHRKMIYGATSKLVRDAELVIMHFSTAINFAVIYNKDILILTNTTLQGRFANVFNGYKHMFNMNIIDTSSFDENEDVPVYKYEENIEKYNKFKATFIKETDTPEKKFFECVLDNLHERLE